MPLVVGIDEAGYGPTLGPLVVAATLWNVPQRLVHADYWRLLRGCVSRSSRGQARLAVNDSKVIYSRTRGLTTLERPVLAFARAAGLDCATVANLLTRVGVRLDEVGTLPWYRDLDQLRLPTDRVRSKFDAVAERLKRCMAESGLVCCGLMAEVVPEDRYNQRVGVTRNKAAVLVEQVLRLIHVASQRAVEQDLVVRADRLGGRRDYRKLLVASYPQRHLHILEVSDSCSRYRLASASSDWLIEFSVAADEHQLPVALASMLAKYLREVLMQRFNAYWRQWLPELRPTAGYYTDARRFLAEIDAASITAGIPRDRFVRCR